MRNIERKQLLQAKNSPACPETANVTTDVEKKLGNNPSSCNNLERQNSMTPPLPPKNAKIIPPPTPLRGITTIVPLAIPDVPAPPRPDSIIIESEVVTTIETLKESTENADSSEAFRKLDSFGESKEKSYTVISEYDHTVETFLCFIGWFLFIFSRILSMVIFFEFYPTLLVSILSFHYICMISYLFYYSKYNDITSFFLNLWLGLVYTFSVIEYRIKFKCADKWLVFYYTFSILQNIFMSLTWYFYGNWNGLWYSYSFNFIFICIGLCFLSKITHYIIIKPKKQRVYVS